MSTAEEEAGLLARKIERTFATVPYPGDSDLVYDNSGDHLECSEVAEAFRGRNWKDLDLDFLRYHAQSIFFLSPAAYRFYLPAYLLVSLRSFAEADTIPGTIIGSLTAPKGQNPEDMDFFLRTVRMFEPEQREAITAFLEFMANTHQDSFPFDEPRIALERYWSRQI
jgi:hypothetical protein